MTADMGADKIVGCFTECRDLNIRSAPDVNDSHKTLPWWITQIGLAWRPSGIGEGAVNRHQFGMRQPLQVLL
jgi:hypothetical protein